MIYHFSQLEFKPKIGGGIAAVFKFPNGFGCSVIRCNGSYGHKEGLYEMAVLGHNGHITYDTPITSDVLGYLDTDDVTHFMNEIAKLHS